MSLQALSDYTVVSRYSRYNKDKKRRETWPEMVDRVFDMHAVRYTEALTNEEFKKEFDFAKEMVKKKRVLGAQRILQFGGEPIFKHNSKVFNCSYGYIDRPAAFNEAMYLLLCGCGVGFSVQTKHIGKLPDIQIRNKGKKTFVAEDSIEGWADCIAAIMSSYFVGGGVFPEYEGYEVEFDLSKIRPEGALIAGQFKAPGPKGLESSLAKIKTLINNRLDSGETRLRPIDAYDAIMHFSDAVLSGGVRRSATICLFSKEDQEMMTAKTGDWFIKNPQRGRSNNSVLLVKDKVSREEFGKIMESTRAFGEPGFVFSDSEDVGYNPCVEIGLYPQTLDGRSGWQFCNLTEGNGKYCDTKEKFLEVCRASAIIGTMQAGYTNFKYLSKETQEITEKEALLGCSITGIMDNPDILLSPEIQKEGAELVKEINKRIAGLIGINQAARTTCVKPAGSTSCVLSSSSGIHPHHAKRYIRRVQANRNEFPVQYFKKFNPLAVEKSVWSTNGTDEVISFLCEVPKGAVTKNTLGAVDLLEKVRLTQQNWVEFGTNVEKCSVPYLRHNVSNTITVKDNEWDAVTNYIYENRKWFAGISLLSASGDLDYPQAPFTSVLNEKELVEEYGAGAILAGGLIVDGLAAFNDNLWAACDTFNGIGQKFDTKIEPIEPQKPSRKNYKTEKEYSSALTNYSIELNLFFQEKGEYRLFELKKEWVRRAKQFSFRYFSGDDRKMAHCLKHCYSLKQWLDLKREYKEIDWSLAQEETETYVSADTLGAQACAGGKCSI
jgi:ribonucleoside-diphosphate reductase alpha chain